jgi:hypothetical protein
MAEKRKCPLCGRLISMVAGGGNWRRHIESAHLRNTAPVKKQENKETCPQCGSNNLGWEEMFGENRIVRRRYCRDCLRKGV